MKPPCFIGELVFRAPARNDNVMILTAPLTFVDPRGRWWRAPEGLVTDGASVGRMLRLPVLGILTRFVLGGDQFTGPFRWAAVMHDAAYARATAPSLWAAFVAPERAAADRMIREAAICRKAPPWRAWSVWAILRVAGSCAWRDDSSKAQKSLSRL